MKRYTQFKCLVLGALLTSSIGIVSAEITVDKSQGQLQIYSDTNGFIVVKVIGPDDVIVVDERYYGNTFNWSPNSGPDGAYRYDVRITEESISENEEEIRSDYVGGSIEVLNGQIPVIEEENREENEQ